MNFIEYEERNEFVPEDLEDGWASDKEYFGSDAISNSDLRVFDKEGPASFWAYKYDPDYVKVKATDSQEFGTLLHTLIYEEQEYKKRYTQFLGKRPTSTQMEGFCQDINNGMEATLAYCNNYSTKNKSQQAIIETTEMLYDDLYSYITALRLQGNKKIITQALLDNAEKGKENYLFHPRVRFVQEMLATDDCEVFRECGIYWHSNYGFDCRAKVDEVIVNHTKKIIYKNDLKSTYNVHPSSFGTSRHVTYDDGSTQILLTGSIAKWDYDQQIAFYDLAINESSFRKDHNCEGYEIENSIMAVKNTAPFNVNCYGFSKETVQAATAKIQQKMENIAGYLESGSKEFDDWQDYKFTRNNGRFVI